MSGVRCATWRGLAVLVAVYLWLPVGAAPASESDAEVADWLGTLSLSPPTRWNIVVCHGFSCHTRTQVGLSDADRVTVANMVRGANPEAERRGVARAVAWFDRRVGRQTGTTTAKAYAKGLAGDRTQFDCIDRAANTTSLFLVMAQWGVLKHHQVDVPVSRKFVPILDGPHSTAVLRERASGRKWAVDPWTHNYGELPDVMPLDRWLSLTVRG